MTSALEHQRHVVLFDCNVYLDVADLVGEPFTWEKFKAIAASLSGVPIPHPTNRAYDSLRAIASCESGRFAGPETLEAWTSLHVDGMVRAKAATIPTPEGRGGLGWSTDNAQGLVDDLIWTILPMSGGGSVGKVWPDGHPPLDYEDGTVYGACRALVSKDPLAHVYCVTRDQDFIDYYEEGKLEGHTTVLSPSAFLDLTRKARMSLAVQKMRGR